METIQPTLDWLWLHFTEMWVWLMLNPERGFMLAVSFLVLLLSVYAMWQVLKTNRQQLLRGSKMPKKARKKWVRKHLVDGYRVWLERQVSVGMITDGEAAAAVRMVDRAINPVPQWEAAIKWQNAQRKKAKMKELTLAERIKLKLSLAGRRLLFTPVKIPGPPVPSAQRKALETPKLKKGEMFTRKTTRA